MKLLPVAYQKFSKFHEIIENGDDVVFGLIVSQLAGVNITEIPTFNSHYEYYEKLRSLSEDEIKQQVSQNKSIKEIIKQYFSDLIRIHGCR